MANGPTVVHLDNCIPIDPIALISAMNGRVMVRPWRWHVNGRVSMPQTLDNGSILPSGDLDVRNVAIGYDGQLVAASGNYTGQDLAHITQFQIVLTPEADMLRPLRSRKTLARITGYRVELMFEEYVINDNLLLAQIIGPYLDNTGVALQNNHPCDAYMSFIGNIDSRICV